MKKSILLAVIGMTLLSSCAKQVSLKEKMDTKAQELTEMAELGTVEYTITKIVKAEDIAWYKIGDRKILFSCKAVLKAGIDLSEFSSQNVEIDEETKSIKVTLPPAKLLSLNMPPEETKLAYQKVSILRDDFSAEERAKLLKQGEEAIIAEVPKLGILKESEKNASDFFKAMLSQMGFSTIKIEFK
ncbi:MAG: DUF4230 domain-containing protein [Paludibacteraceae bacterium]|nr:DUF4230 domain-containing protein [Paludibacteraceae bacterium]